MKLYEFVFGLPQRWQMCLNTKNEEKRRDIYPRATINHQMQLEYSGLWSNEDSWYRHDFTAYNIEEIVYFSKYLLKSRKVQE